MFQNRMSWSIILPVFLLGIALYGTFERSHAPGTNDCTNNPNTDACNVVAGYSGNQVLLNVTGATISGGGGLDFPNQVTANFGSIGGGLDNKASEQSTVAGGAHNTATGYRNSIGGGANNTAITSFVTIAGGTDNTASYYYATISGGSGNTSSGRHTTVGGGSANVASFTHATVGGGSSNIANSLNATIAGGASNLASGPYSIVAGGAGNVSSGFDSAVGGGAGNKVSGRGANIGGGLGNRVTGKYSTLAGGFENMAGTLQDDESEFAVVGGGSNNTASGSFSTIPGGSSNTALASYSFAAGHHAQIASQHDGAFVFADSTDTDFNSIAANEFAVRATGGVRLVTSVDTTGKPIAGMQLDPGSNIWKPFGNSSATSYDDENQAAQVAELQSKVATLSARIDHLERERTANNPLPSSMILVGASLAGLVLVQRLKVR